MVTIEDDKLELAKRTLQKSLIGIRLTLEKPSDDEVLFLKSLIRDIEMEIKDREL